MTKELEKIADLWAEQILNGSWDNGDGLHNALGASLRSMASKPSYEQINTFKKVLIEQCIESFKMEYKVTLEVDYHPDNELQYACEQAGIDTNLLPVKSVVFGEPGKVSYKFGYGQRLIGVTI